MVSFSLTPPSPLLINIRFLLTPLPLHDRHHASCVQGCSPVQPRGVADTNNIISNKNHSVVKQVDKLFDKRLDHDSIYQL